MHLHAIACLSAQATVVLSFYRGVMSAHTSFRSCNLFDLHVEYQLSARAADAHHMLGVQEVQATRNVERNAAAAAPPAERVCFCAAMRAALQRVEQVAALRSNIGMKPKQWNTRLEHSVA